MIDFSLSPRQLELQQSVRRFVREQVLPYERDSRWTSHGPTDELRVELNARARAAGLLAPQAEPRFGGLGLTHVDRAIVFEEAGWSMLGPIALHCAAPDEGNMHLLQAIASAQQQDEFLAPLARAETRSAFAMTEPMPGAGSDPGQLQTVARWDGKRFLIEGRKWLITGAHGAGFFIVMARVVDGPHGVGPTMFLAPADSPGISIERIIDSLDASFTGGHAVVRFDGVAVPAGRVLGAVGEGLKHAQVRLAPARLTHCMRWLGAATRAHHIACDHAARRTAFGRPIGEHEGVSFMLADNEVDLHLARLATWQAAWLLDQGQRGTTESSMTKLFVSEALFRVVDRSLQVLGGLGLTTDTLVERTFRELRAFRIYDGPSEVHRWSVGRKAVERTGGTSGEKSA